MLDAEVKIKAEMFVLTIYIIGYESLLPIGHNILDGREVLDDSLQVFDGLNVLNGLKALTSFCQTDWLTY